MEILEYTARVARLAAPLSDVKQRYTLGLTLRLKELQEALNPLISEIDSIKKYLYYGKNADTMKFAGPVVDVPEEHLGVLHAQLGILTEAQEILEVSPSDTPHLVEEGTDALWYICYLFYTLNFDPEEAMDLNIEKLEKKRYAKGFTATQAIVRDVDAESEVFKK